MAPRLIAVTASLTVPNPVITTARIVGKQCERFLEHVHPVRVRQAQVDDQRVVGESVQSRDGVCAVQSLGDSEPVGLEAVDDDLPKARFIFNNEYGRARTIDNTVCHGTSGERKVFGCVGSPSCWRRTDT